MSGWPIVATMVSGLAAIVGALVILNLRSLSACIKEIKGKQAHQNGEMQKLSDKFAACKQDCDRNTVSKEDWVRSEGYTRRGIDKLSQQLAEMDGGWSIVDRLPEICSRVARETAKELKGVKS